MINNRILIRLTYVALVIFNLLFFIGKFSASGLFGGAYKYFVEYALTFTMLDLFGTGALLVDLISSYDDKSALERRASLFLTALFTMAFLAKIFINFIDSTMVEP